MTRSSRHLPSRARAHARASVRRSAARQMPRRRSLTRVLWEDTFDGYTVAVALCRCAGSRSCAPALAGGRAGRGPEPFMASGREG
jgi:hypothetical protein